MNNTINRLSYIPQLDSFRFFAVLLVIISHWVPHHIINILPNGFIGVYFFFVLSGFLISYNLLSTKKMIAEGKITLILGLKSFYARRTLRIFPLYYAVLILLLLLAAKVFLGKSIWFFCYVPNFYFFNESQFEGMLSHFWSLGVEEQFYFIWPIFLFLINWNRLTYAIIATICLSISAKLFFLYLSPTFFPLYYVLPISCFDAFGMGALLAYISIEGGVNRFAWISRIPTNYGLLFSVIASVVIYFIGASFLSGLSISVASFFLIKGALSEYKGYFGSILNNQVLVYLGRISYGLYVYHGFVPWLVRCFTGNETAYPLSVPTLGIDLHKNPLLLLVVEFLVLIMLSSISWFALERPMNKLKKYFN